MQVLGSPCGGCTSLRRATQVRFDLPNGTVCLSRAALEAYKAQAQTTRSCSWAFLFIVGARVGSATDVRTRKRTKNHRRWKKRRGKKVGEKRKGRRKEADVGDDRRWAAAGA